MAGVIRVPTEYNIYIGVVMWKFKHKSYNFLPLTWLFIEALCDNFKSYFANIF